MLKVWWHCSAQQKHMVGPPYYDLWYLGFCDDQWPLFISCLITQITGRQGTAMYLDPPLPILTLRMKEMSMFWRWLNFSWSSSLKITNNPFLVVYYYEQENIPISLFDRLWSGHIWYKSPNLKGQNLNNVCWGFSVQSNMCFVQRPIFLKSVYKSIKAPSKVLLSNVKRMEISEAGLKILKGGCFGTWTIHHFGSGCSAIYSMLLKIFLANLTII